MTSAPAPWNPSARAARRAERSLMRASRPHVWFLVHRVLRNRREVFNVPGLGYVITSAEGVREAWGRQDLFIKNGAKSSGAIMTQVMGPTAILNMDGPDHAVLRKKLIGLFAPKFLDGLCERALGDIAADTTARLQAGEEIDVARLAQRVTGTMMLYMTGLEDEDGGAATLEERAVRMFALGRQLVDILPTRMTPLDDATLARAKSIYDQLVDGVGRVYDTGSDMTFPGRLRDLGLDLDETRGVIGALQVAGTETTAAGLARIVALLVDTGQWRRLRDDRSLMQGTIDEGLRIATPVPVSTRTTTQDTVFRGMRMKENRLVLLAVTRAMRDPKVIERGDDFDIGRTQPRAMRQLHFGAGPHFCIGFNLATREITTVLDAMLDAVPDVEIVRRAPAKGALLPSYGQLIVRAKGGR